MEKLTKISRKEVLKNLGFYDELPGPEATAKIEECEKFLLENIHPRYMCMCYDLRAEGGRIIFENCDLKLAGDKILSELYYCKKAVLFCATLSGEIDMEIGLEKDIEKGVMLDAIAAAALEDYCDLIELDIAAKFPSYQITYRFSDAYGDLPLHSSNDFVAVLDSERKIGVSVDEKGKFTPRYSITAILGLKEK